MKPRDLAIDSKPAVKSMSPWLLLTLFMASAIFFGANFITAKELNNALTPLQSSWGRLCIALLAFYVVLRVKRVPLSVPKPVRLQVWVSGILLYALVYILFFWGMQYVSAGLGGLIEGTIPLAVCLVIGIFARRSEPLSIQAVLSLLVGFSGLMLVFGDKFSLGGESTEAFGILVLIVMILSFAFGTLVSRQLVGSNNGFGLLSCIFQQTLASTVVVTVAMLVFEGMPEWAAIPWNTVVVVSLLFTGIFPTAICNMIHLMLIRHWGSVRAGAIGYVIPVAAFLFDFLFYGNYPEFIELAGAAIILFGVFLLQAKRIRLSPFKASPSLQPKPA